MKSVWAATGVVLLLALTVIICLPTPALATLPASHVVPSVVGHRAAPEPVVELGAAHGHAAELRLVQSAMNPQVVPEPTMQHKVTPDQGANHKIVPEPEPKHRVVPESSSRHKVVSELATNHKVTLEPGAKHTVVSEPGVEHKVINEPATESVPEPAAKPLSDGIPGALRPAGLEALPELRPGLVRPGNEGEDVATTTTSTTTVDSFTAFCQEACKEGVGGPECNCPGHPVGRRHAPPLTP